MKDKIMGVMEKFSKAMVQPLSYISVAGMILAVSYTHLDVYKRQCLRL